MPDYRHQQRQQNPQQREHRSTDVAGLKEKIKRYQRLKDLQADELVSIAEELGRHLKNIGLKTSQIRRFLDGIRRIDVQFNKGRSFNRDSVILLKPKLAYVAGLQESVKPLMEVLEPAITAGAESYESFKKLLALVEGVISYHKYYGGGD